MRFTLPKLAHYPPKKNLTPNTRRKIGKESDTTPHQRRTSPKTFTPPSPFFPPSTPSNKPKQNRNHPPYPSFPLPPLLRENRHIPPIHPPRLPLLPLPLLLLFRLGFREGFLPFRREGAPDHVAFFVGGPGPGVCGGGWGGWRCWGGEGWWWWDLPFAAVGGGRGLLLLLLLLFVLEVAGFAFSGCWRGGWGAGGGVSGCCRRRK